MKNSIVKIAAILAVFVGLAGFVNAQVKDVKPERIPVKSLLASKIPASLDFVAVTKLENDSVLTFSITNKDTQNLASLDILVIVFRADGSAKGGEGWVQSLGLAKDENADFSRKMKTEVSAGDRVVFTVRKAEGQTGQWKADSTKIIEAAKSFIAGNQYSLPEALFSKNK